MRDQTPSWRWKNGLVSWTYTVPATKDEDSTRCLERVVTRALASTSSFANVARVEITTEERGEDAYVFSAKEVALNAVLAALREERAQRVLLTLDLTVTGVHGVDELLEGAARLYIETDEQSRSDNSVGLWFVLDVDIYSPRSWGQLRENGELARLNGPRLTAFLQRLHDLGARLEDIDAGDYVGQVDATGFRDIETVPSTGPRR